MGFALRISYVERAYKMLYQLQAGQRVSASKYNALLKALEQDGREDVAVVLAAMWTQTKMNTEV